MRKFIPPTLLTMAAAVALTFSMATPASASDWGGYANPASGSCATNFLVKQTDVGTWAGNSWQKLGTLQIKWSNGCPGNYARFQAAGSLMPRYIGISIHGQAAPYNKAGANEEYTTVAYTKVIKLNQSSDRVCAYLDVGVARPNSLPQSVPTTLVASQVLCA
ncbi:hypothetical protein [Pseudoclavibacter sp. AY1H1]|uniref:hypothetical protein n=1 Tax=Pseudoclavibacter sp. AY1H1 TaxID=2080584 RepID=UPI000CE7ADA9|nr:hypothetical protein [Pseudoclavibacter sp. AY1H1]PPF32640.1 hypothetical protein C5E05_19235 [Pseudoclavibacter sp. AY1H1]